MELNSSRTLWSKERFRWIELPRIVDGRDGVIAVAEVWRHIPFDIRRVYFVYNLSFPDAQRGKHAHRWVEQALFCISGSVQIDLDDGRKRVRVLLDRPERGIYMGTGLWNELHHFTDKCILLVLASDHFYEDDYIRDYDEFRRYVEDR